MIIDSDISRLSIEAGELVRLPQPAGATVAVVSGSVWLTQDHDLRDIVLSPGDSFEIGGSELVLITALEEARVALLPAVGRTAPVVRSLVPEAKPFSLPDECAAVVRGWMPALPRHAF